MKIVARPCPHRIEKGEAQRSPRSTRWGLIAYMARCSACGWPNRVEPKDVTESGGCVSFRVACQKCGEAIHADGAEIPEVARACG
ncbi:MAG: hypothetical protein KKH12_16155 [Gammaproteobacteria bacterium]|nr:hypothetical protein [Gammaproteobacteria bacterium]